MTTELMRQLEAMSDEERLEIIEAAARLLRERRPGDTDLRLANKDRMRRAAEKFKHLYEPGGELTEWTCLDTEDFIDMEDVIDDSEPGRSVAG